MVCLQGFRNLAIILVLLVFMAVLMPAISAEYTIEISPTTVTPDQQVRAILKDIPTHSMINMTLNATVNTTPGEQMDYTISDFAFPYEAGDALFKVDMENLEPGTPATVSVIREDGTEASNTGNVSEEGKYNASIIHSLNTATYNVSFIGIPKLSEVKTSIDFGGLTDVQGANNTSQTNNLEGTSTVESTFIPSGFKQGTIDMKVYVDSILQKVETLTVISGAE